MRIYGLMMKHDMFRECGSTVGCTYLFGDADSGRESHQ